MTGPLLLKRRRCSRFFSAAMTYCLLAAVTGCAGCSQGVGSARDDDEEAEHHHHIPAHKPSSFPVAVGRLRQIDQEILGQR